MHFWRGTNKDARNAVAALIRSRTLVSQFWEQISKDWFPTICDALKELVNDPVTEAIVTGQYLFAFL